MPSSSPSFSLSLTDSYYLIRCSSSPPQRRFHELITLLTPNVFPISTQSSRRTISGSHRRRFHIKSVGSDTETPQPQSQSSRANDAESSPGNNSSSSFLSFLCPLLKLFAGEDPSGERKYTLEVATSSISSLTRLPWGSRIVPDISRSGMDVNLAPPLPLQLYEFEACPFCRRVREALTELDLLVEVYPCPKGSIRHRELVKNTGGKEQFPFLIDPNTSTSMYESGDIVKYLFQQYGNGRNPSKGLLESTLFTGWMPTLLRAGRGMTLWTKASPDTPPRKLELFSYENNPYARIVREALCELELPYILYNAGEGSSRTKLLVDVSGSKEVPYLIDPNTGTKMGDFQKILSYLFHKYSAAS